MTTRFCIHRWLLASAAMLQTLICPASTFAQQSKPGLVASYSDQWSGVHRIVPTPNFNLDDSESIHPQVVPAFSAQWNGLLKIDRAGEYSLTAAATIEINGQPVRGPTKLSAGEHQLRIRYHRQPGPARLQLLWESDFFGPEPVPSSALTHNSEPAELALHDSIEQGRLLFAERGCGNCHAAIEWNLELRRGPDLSAAGARLDSGWIYEWLKSPTHYRESAVMPVSLRTDRDRADMTAFLSSLGAPLTAAQPPGEDSPAGRELFIQVGCTKCHDKQNNLDEVGSKYTSLPALTDFIVAPHTRDPHGRMPQLFDPRTERHLARSVAAHLLNSKQRPEPYAKAPMGDASRGARLFMSRGCINCHTAEDEAERLDQTHTMQAPDFGSATGLPLRHHWSFDKLSNRKLSDQVGRNHGAVVGRPKLVDSDRGSGRAFEFDGNAYIELRHFHRPDTMTITAWVNTTSGGSILTWGRPSSGLRGSRELRMNIGQDGKNSLCYGEYNSDGGWRPVIVRPTDINLVDGKWHHIALVRTGETVQHYIDGKPVGNPGRTHSGRGDYTERLLIGALGLATNPTNRFRGRIDDLAIWKSGLSAEQIVRLASGESPAALAHPPVRSVEPFDVGSGCLSATVPAPLPDYKLTSEDRTALRRFLTAVHPDLKRKYESAPLTTLNLRIKQFRCTACHEFNDQNVQQTVAVDEEGRFIRVERPPLLTGAGSKLKTDWMRDVLLRNRRNRPWLNLRMPHFGEAVDEMPELIAKSAGVTIEDHGPVPDIELAGPGIEMIGERRGEVSCIACHNYRGINRQKDGVVPAPDLALAGRTVRREWFGRWMHDPSRLQPGTSMPQLFLNLPPQERALRVDQLWSALVHQERLPLPQGLLERRTEGTRITVGDKPVLFRMSTKTPVGRIDRAINVGVPGDRNFTFDAVRCRLCYVWSGPFLDAGPAWNGRGGNPVTAGGQSLLELADGHVIRIGGTKLKSLRFLGYRLVGGYPVFRYEVDGATVEQQILERPKRCQTPFLASE